MNAYPFTTRTGPQGQVTTSPAYRGTKTNAEVFAEVQARLGPTPPTIENTLTTFHQVVIDWCKQGWKIDPIADLLGYFFTCGGSFPDTTFQPSFEALKIGPGIHWGEDGRQRSEDDMSFENVGHIARIVPVIFRMTDNWTGQVNHYTAGKSILIELSNRSGRLEFNRANGSKVEFRKADNTVVEATDYGAPGATEFTAQVPAGTTGQLTVIVTMMINGSLRSGEASVPLT